MKSQSSQSRISSFIEDTMLVPNPTEFLFQTIKTPTWLEIKREHGTYMEEYFGSIFEPP